MITIIIYCTNTFLLTFFAWFSDSLIQSDSFCLALFAVFVFSCLSYYLSSFLNFLISSNICSLFFFLYLHISSLFSPLASALFLHSFLNSIICPLFLSISAVFVFSFLQFLCFLSVKFSFFRIHCNFNNISSLFLQKFLKSSSDRLIGLLASSQSPFCFC